MATLATKVATANCSLQEEDADYCPYGDEYLTILSRATNRDKRAILKFDISAIPSPAVITSAILSLSYYAKSTTDPVGRTYWAYRATQTGWVENQGTYNSYKTGSAWATPGGDFTTTAGVSSVVPAAFGWVTWDIVIQAQYAYDSVSGIVHVLVKDGTEEGANISSNFRSRWYEADTSLRPKLDVTYELPATGQFLTPNHVW